jgi:hypothetical protein
MLLASGQGADRLGTQRPVQERFGLSLDLRVPVTAAERFTPAAQADAS